MKIAKITEGGYKAQELQFGVAYRWYPERIFAECDCGHKPILTSSHTTCGGGADHASNIRRELSARQQEDEKLHPWRYRHFSEDKGIPA
jgi:hypothetical protein